MAAKVDDYASSKRKPEETSASAVATYQKADETMARTAADRETDEAVARTADDENDPAIRTLNEMSRLNLMTPEWIKDNKKLHYQHQALLDSIYDALQNGEIESDDDDDDGAAAAERSKRLWAGVDLSGLNKGDSEYAVAVYPAGVHPPKSSPEEDERGVAAAESSSSIILG